MLFSSFFHFLDLFLRKTRRSLNADALLFACSLILGTNVQYAVSIKIKGNLNLRDTSWCRRNPIQVETAKCSVVLSFGTLTLEHMNFYAGLIISGRRECLRLAGRNSGIGFDQLRGNSTERLDTERQRGNI